ncbi:hypothetical protein Hanom_Chr08g00751121 [Helianthus anomalus]
MKKEEEEWGNDVHHRAPSPAAAVVAGNPTVSSLSTDLLVPLSHGSHTPSLDLQVVCVV